MERSVKQARPVGWSRSASSLRPHRRRGRNSLCQRRAYSAVALFHSDSCRKAPASLLPPSSAARNPIAMPSPVSGATIAAQSPMFQISDTTGATSFPYVKLVVVHDMPTCSTRCNRKHRCAFSETDQETVGSRRPAPQHLRLYPTTEVGHAVGDLDHAAVSVPNGMQFDVRSRGTP